MTPLVSVNTFNMSQALLIFIKNPKKGKVKTRLASTLGDEMALKIYMELLEHTRNLAEQIDATRLVYYSDFIDSNDEWSPDHFEKRVQSGEDLGERMANAFREVLKDHQKAVIIGSDCASLTVSIINDGFRHLDPNDFVMGPAMDGGYYLLGMNAFYPEVFQDIEWSTETVAAYTIDKIDAINKSFSLLPLLSDIDHEEDWKKYGWKI